MTENEKWTECELADHATGILISHCSALMWAEDPPARSKSKNGVMRKVN